MSPETLLLDSIEEKNIRTSRKSADTISEDALNLTEDTTPPRLGRRTWGPVRQAADLVEGEAGEETPAAVQIIFDERPLVGRSGTSMQASLMALSDLRSDAEMVDWFEAAAILKRDVVRLRGTNYSRHASVLLAVADALSFTDPAEVSTASKAPLFRHTLGLLSEPYISEAAEEEFLGEMLMAGWNLAPSQDQALELDA